MGLTYDFSGQLYIVDSQNNRIALANDVEVEGVFGTNGSGLGQFNSPLNISAGDRGVYVADTGNNRIQCFNLLKNGVYTSSPNDNRYAITTNLYQPSSVIALNNLTNELFYVADTMNNRIVRFSIASDDPTQIWATMTEHLAKGDISAAISCFSAASADDFRQAFLAGGSSKVISAINAIGTLTPVLINNSFAEYYFASMVAGQTITFSVKFDKENGNWKILSF